jgi:hypothetical protein
MPAGVNYGTLSYTYNFSADGKNPVSGTIAHGQSVVLEVGVWTLTVEGANNNIPILEGIVKGIEVVKNTTSNVNVPLNAKQGTTGSLNYSLSFPDTVTKGSLTVYHWEDEKKEGTPVDLLVDASSADGTKTVSGALSLPAGYYLIALDLYKPDGLFNRTDIAHIYGGMDTETGGYALSAADFTPAETRTSLYNILNNIGTLSTGENKTYLLSSDDESMGVQIAANSNGPVTVTIDGGGRTVTLMSKGSLITVEENVTLVLKNITLKGQGPDYRNDAALVKVKGALEIGTGVLITDNRHHIYKSHNTGGSIQVPIAGGGVSVVGGNFTMSGGEISGNTVFIDLGNESPASQYAPDAHSYAYGGGVHVGTGAFTMNGGKISGNTASADAYSANAKSNSHAYGGGVYVSTGTFVMNGGEISGNKASADLFSDYCYAYGGGVSVGQMGYYSNCPPGIFTMNGGKISGNTASAESRINSYAYGGGVYVGTEDSSGEFTMNGGEISGNTVTVSTVFSGATQTLYAYGGGVYAGGIFTMSGGKISDNNMDSTPSAGEVSYSHTYGGGVYVGSEDIPVIFTMTSGEISGNNMIASSSNPSYALGGGVYVGSNDSPVTFIMSGGEISNNETSSTALFSTAFTCGGGVFVRSEDSLTFTMSGGEISGNTASSSSSSSYIYGGGVYIQGGETFAMSGGKISGNTAASSYSSYREYSKTYGGGVYVDSGTFTISGGEISNNTASCASREPASYETFADTGGGGVYADGVAISGGKVSGNSAFSEPSSRLFTLGGGIYAVGDFAMSGGEISGNTASNGGGVCAGGTFAKQSEGIIYGSDAGGVLKNTANRSEGGHAVYLGLNKKLNSTAGVGVTLDSSVEGVAGGWERLSTVTNIAYSSVSGSDPWTLETDGRRRSPVIDHRNATKTRISFTSAAEASIAIRLDVSSDNYDYAFISTLDNDSATFNSGYYSGSLISGSQSRLVTISVPKAGRHFVDIGYQKDFKNNSGSDCAWFKVIE